MGGYVGGCACVRACVRAVYRFSFQRNRCFTGSVCVCVRAYVRTCVRAYVRTCVRVCVLKTICLPHFSAEISYGTAVAKGLL